MMKKILENILLESNGKRLFVKQGKQMFYTDQMKVFPVDVLTGHMAAYVKIERNNIVEIKMPNGEVFPTPRVRKSEQSSRTSEKEISNPMAIDPTRKPARAPYNFVPLNKDVVPAEDTVSFDAFHEGRLSGFISLSIENLTPMFIRGNKENLLNPNGQLILQGSSIRGLVRNLVEICTYAKFKPDHQFEDRRMYFRAMADMANSLREEYKNEIADGVEAGYLSYDKQTRKYFIQPAEGFDRIPANGRFKYYQAEDGIEIHSGSMQGKHHNWLVFPPNDQEEPIPVDPKLIKAYEADDNRADQVFDILKLARKGKSGSVEFPNGVPIFFKRGNSKITSFGHTRNYRLPYSKTIAAHVHQPLMDESPLDLAEAIFGRSGEVSNQILPGRCFSRILFQKNVGGKNKSNCPENFRNAKTNYVPTLFSTTKWHFYTCKKIKALGR
ncbi:MAG: hypothetical protein IPK21_13780 [Haliscomenobacter sp.]|nr:hypothetical protein [Haliscomenobacter sp.]